jgi:hypothetical protein
MFRCDGRTFAGNDFREEATFFCNCPGAKWMEMRMGCRRKTVVWLRVPAAHADDFADACLGLQSVTPSVRRWSFALRELSSR